jgi:hypothetical protein
MNKLRTVHGTVLELLIKNIVGTTQGQFSELIIIKNKDDL